MSQVAKFDDVAFLEKCVPIILITELAITLTSQHYFSLNQAHFKEGHVVFM